MSGVSALDVGAESPALDGLCEDHGWRSLERQRLGVGRIELVRVVTAAPEGPDLIIGEMRNEFEGFGVLPKNCSRTKAPFSALYLWYSPSTVVFITLIRSPP